MVFNLPGHGADLHLPSSISKPSSLHIGLLALKDLTLWPSVQYLFRDLCPSPHVAEQVLHASQGIQLTVSESKIYIYIHIQEVYQSMIVTFYQTLFQT